MPRSSSVRSARVDSTKAHTPYRRFQARYQDGGEEEDYGNRGQIPNPGDGSIKNDTVVWVGQRFCHASRGGAFSLFFTGIPGPDLVPWPNPA